MILLKDQIGFSIELATPAARIVCLVPSITELLYSLNLDKRVVGITKFCIKPEIWYRNKERVGGTKTVDIEKVKSLKPDLILANKEENIKEDIAALKQFCQVYVSDIYNLNDALEMINHVGILTNLLEKAELLISNIKTKFKSLPKHNSKKEKVIYLIWQDPIMAVGKNTFIQDMFRFLNWQNLITNDRYPIVSKEELKTLNPDIIALSSEPFPFKKSHVSKFQELLPASKIILVDGEMFSWYGSRLEQAADYFKTLST